MLKVLAPGTKVEVADGVTAHVYPIGIRQIKMLGKQVSTIGAVLDALPKANGQVDQAWISAAAGRLLPFLTDDLFELVASSVRFEPESVKLEDLPHYALPPILEAWVVENFGEESRWHPWVAAIQSIRSRLAALRKTPKEQDSSS